MRDGLLIDPAKDDTEAIIKVWRNCEKALTSTMPEKKFDEERAAVLRYLVCDEEFPNPKRKAIGEGIIRNWVSRGSFPSLSAQLARGLLGQHGKECAATKDFDSATLDKLKKAAAVQLH